MWNGENNSSLDEGVNKGNLAKMKALYSNFSIPSLAQRK